MTWHTFALMLPPALCLIILIRVRREVVALRAQRDSLLRACNFWAETHRKHVILIEAQYAELAGGSAEEVQRIMDRIDEEDEKGRLN